MGWTDVRIESFEEKMKLLRLWAFWLCFLSRIPVDFHAVCSMLISPLTLTSADLPAGTMTFLHCPVRCALIGCVSDRKDFYHQAAVTRSRAFTNMTPFEVDATAFHDSPALVNLFAVLSKPTSREVHGDRLRMRPCSILAECPTKLRAGFKVLFQGDHLGVEFALAVHSHLLQSAGLLDDTEVVLRHRPFPRAQCLQGLVIDDFFAVSCEPVG